MLRLLIMISALLAGCIEDNPDYCADDEACVERDPAAPFCHDVGNFCYAGCETEQDCEKYKASTPNCYRGECVRELPQPDAGLDPDIPPKDLKINGKACAQNDECKSGNCVVGLCCEEACDECYHCKTGSCRPISQGEPCAPQSCEAGVKTVSSCNNRQQCETELVPCGGFVCADEAECRETCAEGSDECLEGYDCVDEKCQAQLPDGTKCGDNPFACASRSCVHGVCCSEPSCGQCHRCDGDPAGSCTRVIGEAPEGDCPGDSTVCGAGVCGVDGCAYEPPTRACGAASCTADGDRFVAVARYCDGTGDCVEQKTDCGLSSCDGDVCRDGCLTHDDCVGDAKALCDRSTAHTHPKGYGFCVDPDSVTLVGGDLQDAINNAASGDYLKLTQTDYNDAEPIGVIGKQIQIVGATGGAKRPASRPTSEVVVLRVEGSGALTLQGVSVTGGAVGVRCEGPATLTILESEIRDNVGIGVSATSCTVELRRNTLLLNNGGGASLGAGSSSLVNNLVVKNGLSGAFGGLDVGPSGLIVNNTIADNLGVGVKCETTSVQLINSIAWNNTGSEYALCNLVSSNVSEAPDFNPGGYTLSATSPSVGAGNANAPGVSTIDLVGKTRTAPIDQGAYER